MGARILALVAILPLLAVPTVAGQQADLLAEARRAYNAQAYDRAITTALRVTSATDAPGPALIVLARSYLERFRLQHEPADLAEGRRALGRVDPTALGPVDRIEYLVGVGIALYLDDDGGLDDRYSAAAEFFDLALDQLQRSSADQQTRDRVLEWWAGALDRQAQFALEGRRRPFYERILRRMQDELGSGAGSPVALYWKAAAARGAGDLERAWGAAVAAWIRAREFGERGVVLRSDIDRLVTQVILPERARELTPDADPLPTLERLQAEWVTLKSRWPASSRP